MNSASGLAVFSKDRSVKTNSGSGWKGCCVGIPFSECGGGRWGEVGHLIAYECAASWCIFVGVYDYVSLCVSLCVPWRPSSSQGALLQPLTTSLCLTSPQAASDRLLVCVQTFVRPALDQRPHRAPGCLSAFINSHTFTNRAAARKWKRHISQNK